MNDCLDCKAIANLSETILKLEKRCALLSTINGDFASQFEVALESCRKLTIENLSF